MVSFCSAWVQGKAEELSLMMALHKGLAGSVVHTVLQVYSEGFPVPMLVKGQAAYGAASASRPGWQRWAFSVLVAWKRMSSGSQAVVLTMAKPVISPCCGTKRTNEEGGCFFDVRRSGWKERYPASSMRTTGINK